MERRKRSGGRTKKGIALIRFDAETRRVHRHYNKVASQYDNRLTGFLEKLLFGDGRSWVCSQARGEVLEIAIGTGRNLAHYPDGVRLTGVELSPAMIEIAHRRARELGRKVDLRVGDTQALDFEDESFEAVVCTLSLCTIPDDRKAMAEARRVLRPGGRLLLLEHVRSPIPIVQAFQRVLDPCSCAFMPTTYCANL